MGGRTTWRCIFKTLEVKLTDHRAFYRPTQLPGDKRSTFHTRRCPQRPSDSSSQGKLTLCRGTQIELSLVWLQLSRRLLNLVPEQKPDGAVMENMWGNTGKSTNAQTLKLYCFLFLYAAGLTTVHHLTGLCSSCKTWSTQRRTHAKKKDQFI